MNKVLLAITALAFTFTACEKKKSSILPPPKVDTVYVDTNKPVDTSLTIAGIKDIRTTSWSEVSIPLIVSRNNGLEQKVTMTVNGVPANIKAEFSSVTGYTTFNTNLMLEIGFIAPGTYELKIMSVSDNGKTKDYTIQLVIDSMTKKESITHFLSNISNTQLQTLDSADSIIYTQTIILNNTYENELYLRSLVLSFNTDLTKYFVSYIANSNFQVKLNVNLTEGTVTIPQQIVKGRSWAGNNMMDFIVSGTGKLDLENSTYSVTYEATYDDNGTAVTNAYTIRGTIYP